MTLQRRLKRLEALEAQQDRFQRIDPLKQWMSTLSHEDVDTLAEAAEAVKAGLPLAIDPATLERLEANYAAFKAIGNEVQL